MFPRRFVLFLTAILFVLSNGWRVSVAARDTWVSVRSKHLLLIGNGSEKEIRQVAARLEQFGEVVSQLFAKASSDSPVPTTVIVFKDDASYAPFKASDNNAGYFQPGQDLNYITLSTEIHGDQEPYSIVFHEYTHLLVNNSIGYSPPWFNEGLAELYSTLSVTNDHRVILGRPIQRHAMSLRQHAMLPLRTLFQIDYKSPYYNDSQKQSVFYAESWALMHYLMLGKGGDRVGQVLRFLELLKTDTSPDEAFQKAFATSLENMDSELRSYIQQDRYRFTGTRLTHKIKAEEGMASASVSEAEMQAYLGDLLVHSNRSEAENYLQRALILDPNLTLAHEALGILRFRQGRITEALTNLERALSSDSRNALVHYYYASALCHPKQDEVNLTLGYAPEIAAKARLALKNTIALRQDFPDAYNLLAYVNLVTGTDIDQTIELLKTALGRSPGRIDFAYMLGQLYMHNDDYKQARPLLEEVVLGNVEPSVRGHAQLLLKTMTEIENQQVQKEAARRARGLIPGPATQPATAQASSDPSMDLREALRMPEIGETQVQGILISVECDPGGLIFIVKTSERILRLRTDSFQRIRRTTYTSDVRGTITCGPRKPENPVVVCFIPTADKRSRVDGVLSSVEFVPGDFSLVPARN